ncbi:MAG TPA: GNAT family N-acetyltransferase [Jiangellaceae bacterium]|nr:GNAT family N-acetyltransferase [Jiangellaceae bacterium]
MHIAVVGEPDMAELLPLMRAYCDFYGVAPGDDALLGLARALLADPDREGFQLIARDDEGRAVGFATVYWSWSTLAAARTAVMNDLFVHPDARGTGLAEALVEECRVRSGRRGAVSMGWQTRKDNARAQRLYERVGASRAEWVDYSLDTTSTASTRNPESEGSP